MASNGFKLWATKPYGMEIPFGRRNNVLIIHPPLPQLQAMNQQAANCLKLDQNDAVGAQTVFLHQVNALGAAVHDLDLIGKRWFLQAFGYASAEAFTALMSWVYLARAARRLSNSEATRAS